MELYYEKREGYAVLTGYIGMEKKVQIRDFYEGLPVMEIAPGVFENHEELEDVIIPTSLQHLGSHCFRGCKNLSGICVTDTSITVSTFPPTLSKVGERAFEKTSLGTVIFSSPYLELGRYAFHKSRISDVCFQNACKVTLNDGVFADCQELRFVSYGETEIDDGFR